MPAGFPGLYISDLVFEKKMKTIVNWASLLVPRIKSVLFGLMCAVSVNYLADTHKNLM